MKIVCKQDDCLNEKMGFGTLIPSEYLTMKPQRMKNLLRV